MSKYQFKSSIVYVGLAGEEQGLYGGRGLAKKAKKEGWEIIGILNNDMIGNIEGVDVIDNRSFRIFRTCPTNRDNRTKKSKTIVRRRSGWHLQTAGTLYL